MKKLGCAKCGGQKMAKGGSTRLAAAGIPFATGAGQTDGKNMMMKKGGPVKKQPCEYGEYWNGTKCVKNISGKVGAGVLASGIGAMAAYLGSTSDKAMARSKAREEKKAANKKIDAAAKTIASKVMKSGGAKKSFPDLNKDGKISRADILKGRGVIKKKGGVVKRK